MAHLGKLITFAVGSALLFVSSIQTAGAQETSVKMVEVDFENSLIVLPRVKVKMDLSKYPNYRNNFKTTKALAKEFIRLYVGAYSEAYAESRKIPSDFTPFPKYLSQVTVNVDKMTQMSDLASFNEDIYTGQRESALMTHQLDELAVHFEDSGELQYVRHWASRIDEVKAEVNALEERVEKLNLGGKEAIERAMKSLSAEVRASAAGVNQLSSRLKPTQFLTWLAIGLSGLIGILTILSISYR